MRRRHVPGRKAWSECDTPRFSLSPCLCSQFTSSSESVRDPISSPRSPSRRQRSESVTTGGERRTSTAGQRPTLSLWYHTTNSALSSYCPDEQITFDQVHNTSHLHDCHRLIDASSNHLPSLTHPSHSPPPSPLPTLPPSFASAISIAPRRHVARALPRFLRSRRFGLFILLFAQSLQPPGRHGPTPLRSASSLEIHGPIFPPRASLFGQPPSVAFLFSFSVGKRCQSGRQWP